MNATETKPKGIVLAPHELAAAIAGNLRLLIRAS